MRTVGGLVELLGRILGAEDYRRYCEHVRRRHPDREVPDPREFYLSRLEEKYSRPHRCC